MKEIFLTAWDVSMEAVSGYWNYHYEGFRRVLIGMIIVGVVGTMIEKVYGCYRAKKNVDFNEIDQIKEGNRK